MADLLGDLDRHMRGAGWQGEALTLPRANSAPLAPIRPLFSPEVLAVVRATYRRDFESFGFRDDAPDRIEPAEAYTTANVDEIGRLIERAERIGDLSQRAGHLRRQARPPARKRGRIRSIAARAKRRLRSLARAVG